MFYRRTAGLDFQVVREAKEREAPGLLFQYNRSFTVNKGREQNLKIIVVVRTLSVDLEPRTTIAMIADNWPWLLLFTFLT